MIRKIIIILLFFPMIGFAQKEAKLIRKGNKSYEEGKFKEAEINYRKSLELNNKSLKGEFNLGDALYEQKDYKSSQQQFDVLSKKIENPLKRAEAFHNLGNSFLAAKKYQESIDAFKNALRNNPADMETKYNLEYARQKLEEQQKKDQQDKKDQDKNKEKDKKDQDKKDQDKKEDQQDQKDQQQNKDQNQNEKQQKNQQQQPKQISKQDAERMLQALKNEEKKTIEKLKKENAKNAKVIKSEKDW